MGLLQRFLICLSVFLFAIGGPVEDASAGWCDWCTGWRLWNRNAQKRELESAPVETTSGKSASGMVAWSQRRRGPKYGIDRKPLREALPSQRRSVVVLLHGLNSRPEDLSALEHSVRRAGHVCTTFRYPNDQALMESATLLARELRSLGKEIESIQLVSHSMGGLVARAAIEDPVLDCGRVRRLVMIAPPNQGSNLARYARGLDLYEYATSKARRREAGFFSGAIGDGFSQATHDLQPGSPFLRRLNARPRNSRVAYTILAGTRAPLQADKVVPVGGILLDNRDRCSWVSCLERTFRSHVTSNEELFDGIGDGVVSINRAQLDGVDDLIVAQFAHGDVLGAPRGHETQRVFQTVLARLAN